MDVFIAVLTGGLIFLSITVFGFIIYHVGSIQERLKTVEKLHERFDELEEFLTQPSTQSNDLFYSLNDGRVVPEGIQDIIVNISESKPKEINQADLDTLRNFFNELNSGFSLRDEDDDEDEPWKKK